MPTSRSIVRGRLRRSLAAILVLTLLASAPSVSEAQQPPTPDPGGGVSNLTVTQNNSLILDDPDDTSSLTLVVTDGSSDYLRTGDQTFLYHDGWYYARFSSEVGDIHTDIWSPSGGDIRLLPSTGVVISPYSSFDFTTAADRPLTVEGHTPGKSVVQAKDTAATDELRTVFSISNYGPPSFTLIDRSPGGGDWFFRSSQSGQFAISTNASGVVEATIAPGGNMAIAGSLSQGSSRDIKHGIEPVDAEAILEAVNGLDLSTWAYDHAPGVTHLGPMAEDFHAAFGLGDGPDRITTVDADGVALAAIQALSARNAELEARVAALEAAVAALADG